MARFNASESEHYGGQGGGGFFSLKNDMDVAKVRFMYDGIDDVEGLSVHVITLGDKKIKRYVNCLRSYDEPVDNCPFCREQMPTQAKLFIPLYNVKDKRVQVWERGKKFFPKISGLCSRYPHLVEHVFEIERHGAAGSTDTSYEIFSVDGEKATLDDLPELPQVLGGLVLDKTADDMEYFLEEGDFPPTETENDQPVRRSSSRDRDSRQSRRTPANSRRRSEGSDDDY